MRIDLRRVGRGAAVAVVLALLVPTDPAARAAEVDRRPLFQPPPLVADPVEIEAAGGEPPRGDLARATAAATASAPFPHQVLELVNEERLAAGNLPPLAGQGQLATAAESHGTNMAERDFFSHCDPQGNTLPQHRVAAAGYTASFVAENIAAGQTTPQAVMAAWMASSGHRANILSSGPRELGVGHAHQATDQADVEIDLDGNCVPESTSGPFLHYWTQDFGRRNGFFPLVVEREAYRTACAAVALYTYGAGTAQEMRFSNDGVTWSAWTPFAPDVAWSLDPAASGSATVHSELRSGGTEWAASDGILLAAGYPAPAHLELSGETVTGAESHVACQSIRAGDGFEVAASGDLALTAPSIVLAGGFAIAAGGTLRAGPG